MKDLTHDQGMYAREAAEHAAELERQLAETRAKLEALRQAAELFRARAGLGVGFQTRHEFEKAIEASK